MEKLKLEHLASYLPYKLIVRWYIKNNIWDDYTMGIEFKAGNTFSIIEIDGITVKPILRPLSDLADINSKFYNDSNIDLTDQIELNSLIDEILYDKQNYKTTEDIPYKYVKILFEYHIDMFDLIKNNLAINVNDIKT